LTEPTDYSLSACNAKADEWAWQSLVAAAAVALCLGNSAVLVNKREKYHHQTQTMGTSPKWLPR